MDAIRVVKQSQEQNSIGPVCPDTLHSFLSSPQNHLIVAAVNHEAAGFIVAYELQRADRPAFMMLLYEIGVLSEYRRQGIGTALIDYVKTLWREQNSMKIWVPTNSSNTAAMALLTKIGPQGDQSGDEVSFTYSPPY